MLIVATSGIAGRRAAGETAGQAQPETAYLIAAHVPDVFKQQLVESVNVVILRGRHFIQHVRMATNRTLAEDHHAAGQDIRPFNGDGDRRALIGPRQEVSGAEHNALTAGNIHCVNDGTLTTVSTVILHNCRQYRWFFAKHNAVGNQRGGGIHYVGVACDTRQRFFDPFHFTDRDFELAANVRVGAGSHGDGFQAAGSV